MGSKEWKQLIRRTVLRAVNQLPASSLTIGSPRKTIFAEGGSLKTQTLQPAMALTEKPPGTIDKEVFFKFPPLYNRVQPRQYILEIENGRVWGNNGAILTRDDQFIADVSKEFGPAKFDPSLHSIFNRIKLHKPQHFAGSIAVIASPGADVYAHWFCDVLPRLMLLQRAGLAGHADRILLNYSRLDFQLESLSLMGIREDKIVNCKEDIDFHLVADRLYVPSYPNEHGTVNPWVCSGVKEIFRSESAGSALQRRRVYISRSRATGRKLVNEEALFSLLEKEYGFVKIFTEDLTMAEKVTIFGNAECVIAPHGGGLTNILFSGKNCKIVDIFPPGDFDTFFWSIANSNELAYYYFFGKGELPSPENDFMRRNIDIEVDLDKFKDLLNLINLEKLQ